MFDINQNTPANVEIALSEFNNEVDSNAPGLMDIEDFTVNEIVLNEGMY